MRVYRPMVAKEILEKTNARKRRKPEQIVKALAEGEAMMAAGKSAAEVYQKLGVAESIWMR